MELKQEDELWWINMGEGWKIWVPQGLRRELMLRIHGGPVGGHFGTQRTVTSLKRTYWWKGLGSDVKRLCEECRECQTNKISTRPEKGSPRTMEIPSGRWNNVAMDWFTDLPKIHQFDCIL